jgi:carbonic anhydrase
MKLNNTFKLIVALSLITLSYNLKKEQTVFELLSSLRGNGDVSGNPAPLAVNPSETAPAPTVALPTAGTVTPSNPTIIDLNSPNGELSDWLSISSLKFEDPIAYPTINPRDGKEQKHQFGDLKQILNQSYELAEKEGAKNNSEFWFRARGGIVYYGTTKEDINFMGTVYIKSVEDDKTPVEQGNTMNYCFDLFDKSDSYYRICSLDEKVKYKWLCSIQSFTKEPLDMNCISEEERKAKFELTQTANKDKMIVTTPLIIIPTESRNCNEGWNYKQRGADWECQCKEGKSQSPIDLPLKENANSTDQKPNFEFDFVPVVGEYTSIDGIVKLGENLKIYYDRGAIRIFHPNFGKIVQKNDIGDGTVYQAEEIVFHTPSEHTIDGEHLDMEMQIICSGRTIGDINKQAVWSFLFKKKPGHYNKFIHDLNFFELPNPTKNQTSKRLEKDIYIPYIFQLVNESADANKMKPFSFYTYEGSLTSPPCTERTVHYVTADPLPLSGSVIRLFQEAVKIPEAKGETGNIIVTDTAMKNSRAVQPLNGRQVYLYDHTKFGCQGESIASAPKVAKPETGHYEKREVQVTNVLYFPDNQPSGIPDSYVIPKEEAEKILGGEAEIPRPLKFF